MTEITQERRDQIASDRYVTYKWLIVTTISMLGVIAVLITAFSSVINTSLQSKVNTELYIEQRATLCRDIDEIKKAGEDSKIAMNKINANMLLVIRALKIEPVR